MGKQYETKEEYVSRWDKIIDVMHRDNRARRYTCPECTKEDPIYTHLSVGDLIQHVAEKHPWEPAPGKGSGGDARKPFYDELTSLLNRTSQENFSDTPDFVLAEYLINCLHAYELATKTTRRLKEGSPNDSGKAAPTVSASGICNECGVPVIDDGKCGCSAIDELKADGKCCNKCEPSVALNCQAYDRCIENGNPFVSEVTVECPKCNPESGKPYLCSAHGDAQAIDEDCAYHMAIAKGNGYGHLECTCGIEV